MVDLFLISETSFESVVDLQVLEDTFVSDHRPVLLEMKVGQAESSKTSYGTKIRVDDTKWQDFRAAFMREENRRLLQWIQLPTTSAEDAARGVQKVLSKNAEEVFRTNRRTHGDISTFPRNKWFDEDCKVMKKRLRELVRSGDPNSHAVQSLRGEFRKLCRRKKRGFTREQGLVLVELAKRQPAAFWKRFKKRENKQPVQSKEIWEDYCRQLYGGHDTRGGAMGEGENTEQRETSGNGAPRSQGGVEANRYGGGERSQRSMEEESLNADLSVEEVRTAVMTLKTKKAADRDGFTVELLRAGIMDVILPALTSTFNKFFRKGSYFDPWNVGLLHPIFKKGDPQDCRNYRTVTVGSLFGKIFASVIERRISEWAERNNIRAKGQAGFRRKHGTQDHLLSLRVIIEKVRKSGHLFACFVDFSKAFDTVPRDRLWTRLENIGIRGNILDTIKSMYSNVLCQVATPEGLTNSFPSTLGVKQGCPLSPLLFGLYIDPLEAKLARVMNGEPPSLQDEPVPVRRRFGAAI